MIQHPSAGPIALVGSGEYTAAMRETDAALLAALNGRAGGPVALLPTASAREPGKPAEWNGKGVAHFTALGAAPTPLALLNRADAETPAMAAELERHAFFYFSGGDPEYLVETFSGSAAWAAIARRHRAGAAVAGCSAGAMMLGGAVLGVRSLRQGNQPAWRAAIGLVPGVAVFPHFDRMRLWLSGPLFDAALAAVPAGITPVGIDEDTALVYMPDSRGAGRWYVSGRQSVTLFDTSGPPQVYGAGETVPLMTAFGTGLEAD